MNRSICKFRTGPVSTIERATQIDIIDILTSKLLFLRNLEEQLTVTMQVYLEATKRAKLSSKYPTIMQLLKVDLMQRVFSLESFHLSGSLFSSFSVR